MTDKRSAPTPWEKGQLRREATDWFILMRSPEADQHRAEFERWLNLGGVHRAAYNRVSRLFADGKSVNWETLPAPRRVRATIRRGAFLAAGSLMIATFAVSRLFSVPVTTQIPHVAMASSHDGFAPPVQLVTRMGEIRRLRLPDGSWLTLDTDTLVTMHYDGSERELRLEHGRARFEVTHERRPFVVDAGEGSIVAHGTIFDVGIERDQSVHVALLRGAVDVDARRVGRSALPATLARLLPSQAVVYPDDIAAAPPRLQPRIEPASTWPTGAVDFPNATLDEVVESANRYTSRKIRVSDPATKRIAVSGRFRIDKPDALAKSLCDLLGLRMTSGTDEIILSTR